MKKRPMDMNYAELNDTLDSLLKSVDLPSSVDYSSERMNYHRYKKSRLFVSTLSKRIKAGLFYRLYIKNRLGSFREERFLKSFKPFFYIFKIGLPDLLTCIGGKFNDALAANYMIVAMLYDASCDLLKYRKYLKEKMCKQRKQNLSEIVPYGLVVMAETAIPKDAIVYVCRSDFKLTKYKELEDKIDSEKLKSLEAEIKNDLSAMREEIDLEQSLVDQIARKIDLNAMELYDICKRLFHLLVENEYVSQDFMHRLEVALKKAEGGE